MGPLNDLQVLRYRLCCYGINRQWLVGRKISARSRHFIHPMSESCPHWKLPLERLLPHHCRHRLVHAQQLVVARHHFAHGPDLAGIEQNKVFNNVQQAVFGQHAVQQHLGGHAAHVFFVQPLPLAKMFPGAGDGAKTRVVPIAHNQKSIVVKRMGHHVFVQIIPQIAVKTGTDVFVHRLEFNQHQGQAVDKTHQVGPAVVVGRAQPGYF